ncbi:MAG: glycerophosphodiester phosphodiesterase [Ktedonobacteraceae bacterium]
MSLQAPIFRALKKPYVFAHQGGELLAPTNTMTAFAMADAIGGVDFLDIDVHMTRDGHLVGIHDGTVDRTTDGKGRVDSYTLADLQKLDAGYRFQDLRGEYSYRGKGVRIPALEEVFSAYADKYYLHFEVKDAYPKGRSSQVEEKLWTLIQDYHMEKKVIVASFQQPIVQRFKQLAQGQVVMGAGRAEVTRFVLAHTLRLPLLYRRYSQVLEIPLASNGINLKKRSLIEAAHRVGMEVYYWTIDDAPTMKELIGLGADGLFTNRPDLMKKVLLELHLR